ncbi:MAG: ThiF family adenylyltransferase [Fimbriimonadaceae bacterium]|nr:ThiF family adenylyltransferase [Fimbriimonadaceae bacterium]
MFQITADPIVPVEVGGSSAGGIVVFEGKVRDSNQGKRVTLLEYECHTPLAEAEGGRVLEEAVRDFGLEGARVVHRVGILEIGETAVWVGVAGRHRGEAFRACAHIMDQIKARVPIWKREHYDDGTSEWLGCHSDAAEPDGEYHSRHRSLPEIGVDGLRRLSETRVLVVGTGGLGCAALPYLAGAGFGFIGIADGDTVQSSNLHRQPLFGMEDVGKGKATLARLALSRLNPTVRVTALPHLDARNIEAILEDFDIVLDGSDNFTIKFLLNDMARKLGKPLVTASVHRFEGMILTVLPDPASSCLRCLWEVPPVDGCVGNCSEEGVLGALPGVFGALQAAEVIQVALNGKGALSTSMMILDLRDMRQRLLSRSVSPSCPLCSGAPSREGVHMRLGDALAQGMTVLDIRERAEREADSGVKGSVHVPMSDPQSLLAEAGRLPGPFLLVCAHGVRSTQAAYWLREMGFAAYSMPGGTEALREQTK